MKISIELPHSHGPALRTAIQFLSDEIASKVTSSRNSRHDQALTEALVAVGALRAAVCQVFATDHTVLRTILDPTPVVAPRVTRREDAA